MIPIWLIKFAGNRIYKTIKHNRELKKIEEYVNKPNELDIQIKELRNEHAVSNKYLDICNDKIKELQKDSHPPIFHKNNYKDILKRLNKLEKEK